MKYFLKGNSLPVEFDDLQSAFDEGASLNIGSNPPDDTSVFTVDDSDLHTVEYSWNRGTLCYNRQAQARNRAIIEERDRKAKFDCGKYFWNANIIGDEKAQTFKNLITTFYENAVKNRNVENSTVWLDNFIETVKAEVLQIQK